MVRLFTDVNIMQDRFDYKFQLKRLRNRLDEQAAHYVLSHPRKTMREIANELNLSVGALSEIMKHTTVTTKRRKRGPRPGTLRRKKS